MAKGPSVTGGRVRTRMSSMLASRAEIEASDERKQAARSGCAAVAQLKDRARAELYGVLRSVTLRPRLGVPALEAELYDGTGTVRAGLARSTPDRRYRAGPPGPPDGLRLHARQPPRDVQPQVRAQPQAGRVSGEEASAGAGTTGDDVGASETTSAPPLRGVRALTGEDFSFADAIGGARGLVESTLPGLVFVVVYLLTRRLTVALVAASAVAVLAVVLRLVQRTPVTQAFSGLLGVGVGVLWAWWSGRAQDYFVGGLILNAAWFIGIVISLAVRWPAVGVLVSLVRGQDMVWRTDPPHHVLA